MLLWFKTAVKKLYSDNIAIPTCLSSKHFPGLDGLRGISIIIVLLSHLFMNTAYSGYFSGDIGVEIFFVISGFLITSLLLKEKITTGIISLKAFYIRRFLRILPVAYLYISLLIVLNYFLTLNIPFQGFLSAALFYQNIPVIRWNGWYVAHFWSLSVEEQFYITFPFLLVYSLPGYIKTTLIIIIVVPVIGLLSYTNTGVFYSNHLVHTAAYVIVNLFSKTVCILIGSLTSLMLFKGIIVLKDNGSRSYLSFILLILAILIHTDGSIIRIPHCGLFLFPLIIATVILLNLNTSSVLTRFLSNPILVYIGLISYSLYIWQQLFMSSTENITHASTGVNVAITFIVASASYYLYEKKFIRYKQSYKKMY